MKIESLEYADPRGPGWSVSRTNFKDGINLLVGASGSGKTRILNILFNVARFAAQDAFVNGQWTIHFEHLGVLYTWEFDGYRDDDRSGNVASETLWSGSPDGVQTRIFHRSEEEFYCGDMAVPKLSKSSTAIYLLREEEAVKPVHEAFSRLMRRRFWGDDLKNALALQVVPFQLVRKLRKRPEPIEMFKNQMTLHAHLYILHEYFRDKFDVIQEQFIRVFPFVESIQIGKATEVYDVAIATDAPLALIKERGLKERITLDEVSSGMQKVLLIITDIVSSPPNILYMIDEYENSLGANAIDFLPPFLNECGGDRQFIVTTHHPLLINAIPVSDWFLCHRKGLRIVVTHGRELEARYSRSKQQRFVQLLNDPLYSQGVE